MQSPRSIEDQLRVCREYAERQGFTVVATFEDRALSGGASENRAGYQALQAAVRRRPTPFELIVVEDLSRLTRDTGELHRLHRTLEFAGVSIVGVCDGIDTAQRGAKVMFGVKGLFNELYLDDLREKTHRGQRGAVLRGGSPGGRTFGYRTTHHPETDETSILIDEGEAEVVERIFRESASGRSYATIASTLNEEGIPFPAKGTKREVLRKGWSAISVRFILRNEKYVGRWVWNTSRFLKDPDSGKRRRVKRKPEEWVVQERPELRIVSPALWKRVRERLQGIEDRYRAVNPRNLRPGARIEYSKHLLAGLIRCRGCGSRMQVLTTTKKKGDKRYRVSWLYCHFAKTKGPAICKHRTTYRESLIEEALLSRFREAMTEENVRELTRLVNEALLRKASEAATTRSPEAIREEIEKARAKAERLIEFLADGAESGLVREKLQDAEKAIRDLEAERDEESVMRRGKLPTLTPSWVQRQLDQIVDLVRRDPIRARGEIRRHLQGDLEIRPLPSRVGRREAEITGALTSNGLLAMFDEEAVGRSKYVAGARSLLYATPDPLLPFSIRISQVSR